jgi:hypothetical protein
MSVHRPVQTHGPAMMRRGRDRMLEIRAGLLRVLWLMGADLILKLATLVVVLSR